MGFDSKALINDLVRTSLASELKAINYRRNANTWRKSVGELQRLVNVQLSQGNSAAESRFTINLGVYHPQLRLARGESAVEGQIKEYNCDLRVRVGDLLVGSDHWWSVTESTNVDSLRSEFSTIVTQLVIPWIERFHTLDDVFDGYVEMGDDFGAAVAAYVLRRDDTTAFITKALKNAPHENFARMVASWASEHDLPVAEIRHFPPGKGNFFLP